MVTSQPSFEPGPHQLQLFRLQTTQHRLHQNADPKVFKRNCPTDVLDLVTRESLVSLFLRNVCTNYDQNPCQNGNCPAQHV